MENYLEDPEIPWKSISELVERAGSCLNRDDFLSRLLHGVESLIPHDVGGGLLGSDGKYSMYHGLGGMAAERYNEYYFCKWGFVPQALAEAIIEGSQLELMSTKWSQYPNTEFVSDFCRPINLGSSLVCFLPGSSHSMTLHRGFRTRLFNDTEKTTLRILSAHMNNFLSLHKKFEDLAPNIPDSSDLKNRFPTLSNREIEVVHRTCMGFSASLIAKRSGHSRRTIESQLLSVYQKLNVDTKKELVEKITDHRG
jgi:DNA-binding CsgD family transcriptional regulator